MNIVIIGLGRVYEHYKKNFVPDLISDSHTIYLLDIDHSKYIGQESESIILLHSFSEISDLNIDFAIISSISGSHYQLSKELLQIGVNVLTEKPPTMKVSELEELILIAKNSSLKYGVLFQNRFNPAMQMAKELVEKKYLGIINICSIRLHWSRSQSYYNDGWHGTWKDDGGVINQQAIHHVDAMQWINGPFNRVSALASNQINRLDAEDTMNALVEFKSGSVGTIEASTAIRPEDKEASIFIAGTNGYLKVGGIALNIIEEYDLSDISDELKVRLDNASTNVSSGYGHSHKLVVYDFISSIQNNHEPAIAADSTINTLQAIHGIYQSCETGAWANVGKNTFSKLLGN